MIWNAWDLIRFTCFFFVNNFFCHAHMFIFYLKSRQQRAANRAHWNIVWKSHLIWWRRCASTFHAHFKYQMWSNGLHPYNSQSIYRLRPVSFDNNYCFQFNCLHFDSSFICFAQFPHFNLFKWSNWNTYLPCLFYRRFDQKKPCTLHINMYEVGLHSIILAVQLILIM